MPHCWPGLARFGAPLPPRESGEKKWVGARCRTAGLVWRGSALRQTTLVNERFTASAVPQERPYHSCIAPFITVLGQLPPQCVSPNDGSHSTVAYRLG